LKLLAVDTSTEACSAALYIDGEITRHYELAPREHSRLILGMVDDLLHQQSLSAKDIDVLAFGRGPGSFMGLRIAAGVVQGISFAHSIPVVPVSTLAALSSSAIEQTGVKSALAIIDARMKEVYWGVYTQTGSDLVLQGKEVVTAPDKVLVPDSGQWVSAGSRWAAYADVLEDMVDDRFIRALDGCFPSAEAVARLAVKAYEKGMSVSAAEAVPVYIRDKVAKKPGS
jgi:tRNA threonylcarbamoyladenosine biosynthesis protein TsaB